MGPIFNYFFMPLVLSVDHFFTSCSPPCFCILRPLSLDTSACKWQSALGPFCFSFIDDSWLESRSVDRFINRSFARSYARSFDRYKHVAGIVTWLCSMSCAMENQAREDSSIIYMFQFPVPLAPPPTPAPPGGGGGVARGTGN